MIIHGRESGTSYELSPEEINDLVFEAAGAATAGLFARSGEVFPEQEISDAVAQVVWEKIGYDVADVPGYGGVQPRIAR